MACIQCRTEIKLKSYKGILPYLPHFIRQLFTRVGLLLRLVVLSSASLRRSLTQAKRQRIKCGKQDSIHIPLYDFNFISVLLCIHAWLLTKKLNNKRSPRQQTQHSQLCTIVLLSSPTKTDVLLYKTQNYRLNFFFFFQPKLYVSTSGDRIAQCQHIKLITTTSLPVQIDGETCKLKPSVIEVTLHNKANMIKKVPLPSVNPPLRG